MEELENNSFDTIFKQPRVKFYQEAYFLSHRDTETRRFYRISRLIPFFNSLELKFIKRPTFLPVILR